MRRRSATGASRASPSAFGRPLYRQIRLSVFAVLVYSVSVVDVAMILGPKLPPTLPVRVTQWAGDDDLGARFLASAGAFLQLGVVVAAMAIWIALERIGKAVLARLTFRDGALRGTAQFAPRAPSP